MSEAKAQILSGVRRALQRAALPVNEAAGLEARLRAPAPNLVPRRAQGADRAGLLALFERLARDVNATVARVESLDRVSEETSAYLARHNLPAAATIAPDPLLDRVPWSARPLLRIRRGAADGEEAVGVSAAFSAIAETGTLMLASGPGTPAALNFLPDTHIVVVPVRRMVGAMEDAWRRLRESLAGARMPRTINFITGPSRTGDIEQKIEMGAHGPRRLHIIFVEDDAVE